MKGEMGGEDRAKEYGRRERVLEKTETLRSFIPPGEIPIFATSPSC